MTISWHTQKKGIQLQLPFEGLVREREGESGGGPRLVVWCGTEADSYARLIDSCITQLKAQGPSRTCTESKEEEEELLKGGRGASSSSFLLP